MKTICAAVLLFCSFVSAETFDKEDWSLRCWNSEVRKWETHDLSKISVTTTDGLTTVTNTSAIHKHAHFVFPQNLQGDFSFTIELQGGYELGFLNRAGKDEMLYVELTDDDKFHTYTLSRVGTRIAIKRNGRDRPMLHFRFDYGEDFMITLAIKQDKSAIVKSYSFSAGTPTSN